MLGNASFAIPVQGFAELRCSIARSSDSDSANDFDDAARIVEPCAHGRPIFDLRCYLPCSQGRIPVKTGHAMLDGVRATIARDRPPMPLARSEGRGQVFFANGFWADKTWPAVWVGGTGPLFFFLFHSAFGFFFSLLLRT